MPRAKKVCKKPLCGKPVVRTGLCDDHLAEWERARGTAAQRGYGTEHQRRRARLVARAIGTDCPRCGKPMNRDQALELDHTTPLAVDRRSVGDAVTHASCNPKGTHPDNYRRH